MAYGRAHTTTSKTWLKRARPTIGSMATRAIESCWLCWTMHGITWNMCGIVWTWVVMRGICLWSFLRIWINLSHLCFESCRMSVITLWFSFRLFAGDVKYHLGTSNVREFAVENQYLPLLRQPVYHIACDLLRLAVTCTVSHKPKMQSNALGEPVDQWSCCTSSMHGIFEFWWLLDGSATVQPFRIFLTCKRHLNIKKNSKND